MVTQRQHTDRYPLVRSVHYERGVLIGREETKEADKGVAVMINISNGGMCLMIGQEPFPQEVFRIQIPTPLPSSNTPTLAEVRWVEAKQVGEKLVYIVGLRFVL